ncbi:MAG: hypothetical protein A3F11_02560 [Gammaproteobacteria bacterium RIFCSPHIGHO2_12_FULL_37_14]|nr:MAG: hypothetical protein A3F11_02560 [Gammaproteobacteria bacterium RIFCSPHIGHO2_12_FULL_37_14]
MRLITIHFLYAWIIFLNVLTPVFAQSTDPVILLQQIADNMIAGLKANKATLKTKPTVVYNLAYRYVVPNADLAEMSKRVLPPSVWNSSSALQRKQFQQEFTTTIIRTYASALTAYEDQTIKFYPVRSSSGRTVEVTSEIISNNRQPIRVVYRLVHTPSGWKLFDMSVEGVSMLDSFRAQFSDLLSQGSMDQLLAKMSRHNNRIIE